MELSQYEELGLTVAPASFVVGDFSVTSTSTGVQDANENNRLLISNRALGIDSSLTDNDPTAFDPGESWEFQLNEPGQLMALHFDRFTIEDADVAFLYVGDSDPIEIRADDVDAGYWRPREEIKFEAGETLRLVAGAPTLEDTQRAHDVRETKWLESEQIGPFQMLEPKGVWKVRGMNVIGRTSEVRGGYISLADSSAASTITQGNSQVMSEGMAAFSSESEELGGPSMSMMMSQPEITIQGFGVDPSDPSRLLVEYSVTDGPVNPFTIHVYRSDGIALWDPIQSIPIAGNLGNGTHSASFDIDFGVDYRVDYILVAKIVGAGDANAFDNEMTFEGGAFHDANTGVAYYHAAPYFVNDDIEIKLDGGTHQILRNGVVVLDTDTLFEEVHVRTYDGDDTIEVVSPSDPVKLWAFGGAGNNNLYGGAGDDYFEGRGGVDTIYGRGGDDIAYSGSGYGTYYGYGYGGYGYGTSYGGDFIFGGDGDDELHGGQGADWIDGGLGDDIIYGGDEVEGEGLGYYSGNGDIIYDYADGFGNSNDDDVIYGGAGNDLILGYGGGNDIFFGGSGDDYVLSVAGDNILYGGPGEDFLHGGTGIDYLIDSDTNTFYNWGRVGHDPIVVTTLADENEALGSLSFGLGDLSLREALAVAAMQPGPDTIVFAADLQGSISISTELSIGQDLTIIGPGSGLLTIDAGGTSRVFSIASGVEARILGLTLTDGYSNGNGGAINSLGDLTLEDVHVLDSYAMVGAGVYQKGGSLSLLYSVVRGNGESSATTTWLAGGLYVEDSDLVLESTTIAENTAEFIGGLYPLTTNLTSVNSTFSGNRAEQGVGGAIYFNSSTSTSASFTNTTITDNSVGNGSGGGLYVASSEVDVILHNTILAGNRDGLDGPDDLYLDNGGAINSVSSYNLVGYDPNGYFPSVDNQIGTLAPIDPLLAPLGDYGGPTPTHALMPDSPAIDAGSDLVVTNADVFTDQRGPYLDRIVGTAVDIGATESHIIKNLDDSFTIYGLWSDDAIEIDANGFTLSYARGSIVREIDLSSATKIIVESLGGNDVVATDAAFDVPMEIYGGSGADHLIGGAASDLIDGGDGNDIIYGGAGDDELLGGPGNDVIYGDEGADLIYGDAGADILYGGAGNDSLYGGDGVDVLDGGTGTDAVHGDGSTDVMVADVSDPQTIAPEVKAPSNVSARLGETDSFRILAEDNETLSSQLTYSVAFSGQNVPVLNVDYRIVRLDDLSETPPVFEWFPSSSLAIGTYNATLTVTDADNNSTPINFTATYEEYNFAPPVVSLGSTANAPDFATTTASTGLVEVKDTASDHTVPEDLPIQILQFSATDTQTDSEDIVFGNSVSATGVYDFDPNANDHFRSTTNFVVGAYDTGINGEQTRSREHNYFVTVLHADRNANGITVVYDPGETPDRATYIKRRDNAVAEAGDSIEIDLSANLSSLTTYPSFASYNVGSVSHGTLSAPVDGVVTYTPNVGFEGLDSFTWSFTVSGNGVPTATSNTATFFIEVGRAVKVNLSVEGLSEQDEDTGFGALVQLNNDFDYNRGTESEREDLTIVDGPVPEEDDLRRVAVEVSVLRADAYQNDYLAHFEVRALDGWEWEGTNRIRLWTDAEKSKEIIPERVGASPGTRGESFLISELQALDEIYVEGIGRGRAELKLVIEGPSTSLFTGERMPMGYSPQGIVTDSDALNLAVGLGLTAYRPMHGPGTYDPFMKTKVPEDWETDSSLGPGIRVNGDDDNDDGIIDFNQSGVSVAGENDLIEIEVAGLAGMTSLVLEVSAGIGLFNTHDKSSAVDFDMSGNRTLPLALTNGVLTVYAEWNVSGHGSGTIDLIDTSSGTTIDSLLLHTFEAIAVGISGETNAAFQRTFGGDPNTHLLQNIFTGTATTLYGRGYDVHFFDVYGVEPADSPNLQFGEANISGPIVDEVHAAILDRSVTHVYPFGWSHGGGAVHNLTQRLTAERAAGVLPIFTIDAAAYVDAVKYQDFWGLIAGNLNNAPEDRPPAAVKYANWYQLNWWDSTMGLHGTSVPGAIPNDDLSNFMHLANLSDHTEVDLFVAQNKLLSSFFEGQAPIR